MEGREDWLLPVLSFSLFDLWLLVFPFEGFLLPPDLRTSLTAVFIVFHAFGYFFIFSSLPGGHFNSLSRLFTLVSAFITALFPFIAHPSLRLFLFALLGFSSSFILSRIALALAGSSFPLLLSAVSLSVANLLVLLLFHLFTVGSSLFILPLLGLSLASALLIPEGGYGKGALSRELLLRVPLVFLLYFFIATSYIQLSKYYSWFSAGGFDALLYVLGVILAFLLYRKWQEGALITAILSLVAVIGFLFTLFRGSVAPLLLALVQLVAGFNDIYALSLAFKSSNVLRSFSLFMGVSLLGAFAGLPMVFSDWWVKGASKTLFFIMALIFVALYFSGILGGRKEDKREVEELLREKGVFRESFSKREWEVLMGILEGKSFKEISRELGISQSTVRTYSFRVYSKLGVGSKRELIKKLKE